MIYIYVACNIVYSLELLAVSIFMKILSVSWASNHAHGTVRVWIRIDSA